MKIIGISGRKQSGKNTCANYITGHILKQKNMVEDFNINSNGELEIKTSDSNGNIGWGIFDVLRKDKDFIIYAENELWPYVKIYNFADELKRICNVLFDLTPGQVYGSDKEKNELTDIFWENVPENSNNLTGRMTAREFMQHFGTNIMRKIKDNVWVDCTLSNILYEESEIAIIPDVRFPNEINAIHNNGGIVIRLTRDVHGSDHKCENTLDQNNFDWSNFDYIIDNKEKTIEELQTMLSNISHIWRI